jgi:hypothetical protein
MVDAAQSPDPLQPVVRVGTCEEASLLAEAGSIMSLGGVYGSSLDHISFGQVRSKSREHSRV